MLRLCLAIGVSSARPLSSLPGALTAAEEIGEWASRAGYTTAVITDKPENGKKNPVTVGRIRDALLELLPENDVVQTFILHFAGHGFREGAEQNLWFPSDWHEEMRVISVEGLKRQLFRHGIQNLTIISDACRSLPTDIEMADLTRDSILPRGPYELEPPVIDRFNAVSDGQTAYMLSADANAPARCIFSTVLLEGLSGHREEAFDKHLKDSVIAESLALFSTLRMREIGERYRLKCVPDNIVGIPREHIIYHKRAPGAAGGSQPPRWPAPPKLTDDPGGIDLALQTHIDGDLSDFNEAVRVRSRHEQVHQSFRLLENKYLYGNVNLVVLGGEPVCIWATLPSRFVSRSDHSFNYKVQLAPRCATQVLVEFDDGVFASAIVYPDLVTVLSRDEEGVIGWACTSRLDNAQPQIDASLDVIADLHLGNVAADRVDDLAAKLRAEKHVNPIFGAVSSYLYDYSGDIESIRRMAYFYCDHEQGIPFDIAYMGLLQLHRAPIGYDAEVPAVEARKSSVRKPPLPEWVTVKTAATFGSVAGIWPWLRQGWEFIEEPGDMEKASAESLRDVIPFLLPSPFTSFKREGGEILIERFRMEKSR